MLNRNLKSKLFGTLGSLGAAFMLLVGVAAAATERVRHLEALLLHVLDAGR